jgi:hypothetical protein
MFKRLDKNGDGKLDASELARMAKRHHEDAGKMLADLDTDQDGSVSSDEMAAGVAKRQQEVPRPDGANGEVTTALLNILQQLQDSQKGNGASATGSSVAGGAGAIPDGRDSRDADFAKLDANGDGTLDKTEFAAGGDGAESSSASDITTAFLNILKQLQASSGGAGDANDPVLNLQNSGDPIPA